MESECSDERRSLGFSDGQSHFACGNVRKSVELLVSDGSAFSDLFPSLTVPGFNAVFFNPLTKGDVFLNQRYVKGGRFA